MEQFGIRQEVGVLVHDCRQVKSVGLLGKSCGRICEVAETCDGSHCEDGDAGR